MKSVRCGGRNSHIDVGRIRHISHFSIEVEIEKLKIDFASRFPPRHLDAMMRWKLVGNETNLSFGSNRKQDVFKMASD